MDINKYMTRCLELAQKAKAAGHTAVGSLIVKDGKILTEASEGSGELPQMTAHAEMIAVLKAVQITANKDLSGTWLVTTVEPCFMCSYLIRQTGISKIIYGTTTDETGGDSSQFPFLTSDKIRKWAPAPEVVGGVMAAECRAILRK